MDRVPAWKPLLIVAVILLGVFAIWIPGSYGPRQRLKPGLDLAGGTTLIYQVSVSPEQGGNSKQIVEDVISVLRARVDPQGVRNLVWRPQTGNRIEIQMPLPPAETRELRQQYLTAREALLAGNISATRLSGALRLAGEDRGAALAQLAGENPELHTRLTALAEAHDDLTATEAAYQPAEDAKQKAESALAALPESTSPQAKAKAQAEFDRLLNEAQALAEARNASLKRFHATQDAVLASNIDPRELERVLSLYDRKAKPAAIQQYHKDLASFKDRRPDRTRQIQAVAEVWEKYAHVKDWLDDPNDLIAMLRGSGILEFRIALPANQVPDAASYRQQLEEKGPRFGYNRDFRWFPLDSLDQFVHDAKRLEALKKDPTQWPAYLEASGMVGQMYNNEVYLLLANTPAFSLTASERDWRVVDARPSYDQSMLPAVSFTLNPRGGQLMQVLTRQENINRPMAILLDGKVKSAPHIISNLSTRIEISSPGGFGPKDVEYLVRTLKAGAMKGAISEQPISIQTTGPQLGQDNLRRGLSAATWSIIVVAGFMIAYYFFAGLVATFALLLNILLILAAMAFFQGTFTLGGIAGIILTIGMAVDANVLIYERIREELERKTELRAAIRLGFERAFVTILDSNLTTIISAVVLYYTATADIKGFALTLIIGLGCNLFAAVFCTRVVFDLWVQWSGAKNLPMLPTVLPGIQRLLSPSVDWYRLRHIYITASLLIITVGFAGMYFRGQDMLDIEFRSGTRVTFALAPGKTLSLEQVRQRVDAALPKQINTVTSIGAPEAGAYSEFAIQTLDTDAPRVSTAIKRTFGDVLAVQQPVHFATMGDTQSDQAPPVTSPPVYPIDQRWLGPVIDRPDLQFDASEYLGGVAVLLQDMQPQPTADELIQRINRMTQSPQYASLPYRQVTVVGLDLAPGQSNRYTSAVVLARDLETNYSSEAALARFAEPGGLAQSQWSLVRDALLRDTSLGSVTNFDSQVSATMQAKAAQALILGNLAVMAYVWLRFGSLRYGAAAVLALIHDVAVAMGMVALSAYFAESPVGRALGIFPFRIDLTMVAAMLTLVGYSVNDTIVIFDRIRENRGKLATATPAIINDSVNQTISRTLLTASSVFLVTLILYAIGGRAIRGFAYAMLIGTVVGCYSSIAIASPLLLVRAASWGRAGAALMLLAGLASSYGGLTKLGVIGPGPATPTPAAWALLVVGLLLLAAAVRLGLWSLELARQPGTAAKPQPVPVGRR